MPSPLIRYCSNVAVLLCLLLSGCQPDRFVVFLEHGVHPLFCISSSKTQCDSAGSASQADIMIYESDEKGSMLSFDDGRPRVMWFVASYSNETVRTIRYGEVPSGWEEQLPPQQFESGKMYSFGTNQVFLYKENSDGEFFFEEIQK